MFMSHTVAKSIVVCQFGSFYVEQNEADPKAKLVCIRQTLSHRHDQTVGENMKYLALSIIFSGNLDPHENKKNTHAYFPESTLFPMRI